MMDSGPAETFEAIRLSSQTPLVRRYARHLVERVDPADFSACRNVWVKAASGGEMALTRPLVRPESASSFHIQRPVGMPEKPGGFLDSVVYPPMTLARLDNVICLPGGVALSAEGVLLSDIFAASWDSWHHHVKPLGKDRWHLSADAEVEARLSGCYLYLDYQHFDHYGHFLLDVLSRLWAYAYAESLGVTRPKVLIRKSVVPFGRDLLRAYGIPDADIVELERPVVCDELLVASKSLQIQEYVSPLTDEVWRRIRDGVNRTDPTPERIYVSRSRHPTRPMTNELAVEALFRQRGFEVIHPQERDAGNQAALFANARLIAGAGGTNMFNIAFQDRLESTFILTSPSLIHYSEQFVNGGRKATLQYFVGALDREHPDFNPHNVNTAWYVPDIDALGRAVDDWLAQVEPGR